MPAGQLNARLGLSLTLLYLEEDKVGVGREG